MPDKPDNTQLWEYARAKIEHEDKWIQQRVSWNLASTSFLLAAYSGVLLMAPDTRGIVEVQRFLATTIPFLGICFSTFVLFGLAAAWLAQDKAEEECGSLSKGAATGGTFPGLHSRGAVLVLGKIASWGTTIAALVMWFGLLAASAAVVFARPDFHWR
jgi:hypothetical protein